MAAISVVMPLFNKEGDVVAGLREYVAYWHRMR